MKNKQLTPITVAINVPVFPNIVQTYILSLIVGLERMGIEISILASMASEYDSLPPAINDYGLLDKTLYIHTEYAQLPAELLSLPLQNAAYRNIVVKMFRTKLWKKYGWRYFIKALVRAKAPAQSRFDIMHCHKLTTTYDYLFIRDILSIPVVTTFHGKEPRSSNPLSESKTRIAFENNDVFFVNTHFAENQLLEMGCPANKIRIIPQGTNLDSFPFHERAIPGHGHINLITVGRLSIEKGQHVAIRAVSRLVRAFPGIRYHLIGNGPERDELARLISELELGEHVSLHGLVSSEELASHYTKAHIFILPSIDARDGFHVETQGVVLQEAQASGIPVVASKTGGIPEVIHHGRTGLLFNEGNDKLLTERIQSLLEDSDLYRSLSVEGRKDVEKNFSIETICSHMSAVYREAITAASKASETTSP